MWAGFFVWPCISFPFMKVQFLIERHGEKIVWFIIMFRISFNNGGVEFFYLDISPFQISWSNFSCRHHLSFSTSLRSNSLIERYTSGENSPLVCLLPPSLWFLVSRCLLQRGIWQCMHSSNFDNRATSCFWCNWVAILAKEKPFSILWILAKVLLCFMPNDLYPQFGNDRLSLLKEV